MIKDVIRRLYVLFKFNLLINKTISKEIDINLMSNLDFYRLR
jgi:hypothetical protein